MESLKKRRPILAVDFDGTITRANHYPDIGELMPGCREALTELHDLGAIIVIWTCREGPTLDAAIQFLRGNAIPFDYVNEQTEEMLDAWGNNPRKVFANYYIDDLNVGGFPGWVRVRNMIKYKEGWAFKDQAWD
jgi:hypothetical protein